VTALQGRRAPDAQITATHGYLATGDALGVWLALPCGLVWMAPDAAEALASALSRAAADCITTRLVTPKDPAR
jgi:glyoxylase-like metal-dependent hydrolase (beta-lactamase superfamily II)